MKEEVKNETNYQPLAGAIEFIAFNSELDNYHFGVLQKHRKGSFFLLDYSLKVVLMIKWR